MSRETVPQKLDFLSDDPTTRRDTLKGALLGADGLIAPLEQAVRFGLVMYGNATPYFPECPDLVETMPPAFAAPNNDYWCVVVSA